MTTGTVGSNNLTSLYSNTTSFTTGLVNSSVYSVNGGLGVTVNPTTGNVVVSIGQDVATTANVQFANVTATGNLSNNYYTLANAVGTNGQVLTTNGAGVTTWTTPSTLGLVNSVSGSGAGISVSPTTGAVVVSNTGVTSIVAGSNISISGATGAVTISATGLPTGNVVGPASATDNAIARYDLTTGKLIQNSTVIIADNGNLGINTTNPLYELTVNASGDGYSQIGMENAERTWLVTNDDGFDLISYSVIPSGGSAINRLQFNATNGNQWFNSGYLGVANSSPTEALDVTGNGKFSGTISTEGVLVNLTTPVHQGQLLYVSDDATPTITNSSLISWSDATYRPNFQGDTGLYGRIQTGAQVSNNTGAVNYTTGDGSGVLVSVDSDSQSSAAIGTFTVAYDTTGDHEVRLTTSTNNFANDQATSIITSNTLVFPAVHGFAIGDKLTYSSATQNGLTYNTTYYVIATGFTTTQCQVSLTLGGSAVALTNGTGLSLYFFNGQQRLVSATSASVDILATTLLFNATNTGIPFTGLAGIEVERGTTGANQYLKWDETYDFWRASSSLYADDYLISGIGLATNGNNITYNNENISPAGTCNLQVSSGVSVGVAANFRWNDSTKRWQDTIDGSIYYNLPNQNLDTTDDVNFASVIVDGITTYNSQTTTTTALTPVSISATSRLSQKSIITIIDNVSGEMHMLEALTFRKGTTAYLTTYAEIYSNAALATFTATGTGGFTSIIATPLSTNSTTFNVARISLD